MEFLQNVISTVDAENLHPRELAHKRRRKNRDQPRESALVRVVPFVISDVHGVDMTSEIGICCEQPGETIQTRQVLEEDMMHERSAAFRKPRTTHECTGQECWAMSHMLDGALEDLCGKYGHDSSG